MHWLNQEQKENHCVSLLRKTTLALGIMLNSHSQEVGTLFVGVPLQQVHLHLEALAKIVEHLQSRGAALLRDHAQHLGHTALVEGLVLTTLDQVLVNL